MLRETTLTGYTFNVDREKLLAECGLGCETPQFPGWKIVLLSESKYDPAKEKWYVLWSIQKPEIV
jgi:hypothetical protein